LDASKVIFISVSDSEDEECESITIFRLEVSVANENIQEVFSLSYAR